MAISDGATLLCLCEEISEHYQQSEKLHLFVQWALEGAELSIQDIEAVSLGMGPGSYTGLRIGASAAKGFCYALEIPLVAINSLHTLSAPFVGMGYDVILPLVDARRMEVYTASYDGQTGRVISETENLILHEDSFSHLADKKLLFVGDGATKAKDILKVQADYQADVFPSAEHLMGFAHQKALNSEFEDIAYFEPFYLKDFHGTKPSHKA